MTPVHRVVVHLPGQGRTIDMGSFRMTVKAESDDTGDGLSVLEAAEPPGFGPPMHIHRDAGEAFYVLSGEYVMFVEHQETVCPAGSFVYIPPGVVHGFRVGAVPSRKLNIYVPAAMVGYFDELAEANRLDAQLEPDALGELARRYRMEVTGDVPQGYV
jgi:quercetin dioxygenase-like cupin family protein